MPFSRRFFHSLAIALSYYIRPRELSQQVRFRQMAIFTCALAMCLADSAGASVLITATQQGSNVVFSGAGTLDVSSLTRSIQNEVSIAAVVPTLGNVVLGDTPSQAVAVDIYGVGAGEVSGLASFGSGVLEFTTLGSGDRFGIAPTAVTVPKDYISGDSLSGTLTYDNSTFSSLGITPGNYTWSWGSGVNSDGLTLSVVTPEPGGFMLLVALSCQFCSRRRRSVSH